MSLIDIYLECLMEDEEYLMEDEGFKMKVGPRSEFSKNHYNLQKKHKNTRVLPGKLGTSSNMRIGKQSDKINYNHYGMYNTKEKLKNAKMKQLGNKIEKEKRNIELANMEKYNKEYDLRRAAEKAKDAASAAKKDKITKAAKIGAGVAAAGALAYGGKKLYDHIKNKRAKKAREVAVEEGVSLEEAYSFILECEMDLINEGYELYELYED